VWIEPEEWPTLSRLLDAALDVAPEGRERWLDSLADQDLPAASWWNDSDASGRYWPSWHIRTSLACMTPE
jgi:hypothetical protein